MQIRKAHMLLACLLITPCVSAKSENWSTIHKNLHEDMKALREDMTDWIEQSRKEMQELFDSLSGSAPAFTSSYRSGVGFSFEETDEQLHVNIQLPKDVQVDKDAMSAEMEDNALMLRIPYTHGHIELEVTESTLELTTKQEIKQQDEKKADEDKAESDKAAAYMYTAQSQMMHSLPARIAPSSIKKGDLVTISHDDEDGNVLTLAFDKKQRANKLRVTTKKKSDEKQAESGHEAAEQDTGQQSADVK